MRWISAFITVVLVFFAPLSQAEDFSFDVDSYQTKNYHFSGFLQGNIDHQRIATDSYASRLFFLKTPTRDAITENTATIELSAEYKKNNWSGHATYHTETSDSEIRSNSMGKFYEALLAYQSGPDTTLEIGKKSLKWGKGYAWNPVGFVERPKNPDDPELGREGYVVATADFIKSYQGSKLQTVALTPVYLPVTKAVNNDFGEVGHDNLALKLYALYKDTDIDVMWLGQGSRSKRIGIDFARNISTNFEIHAEWAKIDDLNRLLVASNGTITTEVTPAHQWLVGLRYLSENETTLIAEYYHNSVGYSSTEFERYYQAIDLASATNNTTLLSSLANLGEKSYLSRTPGEGYVYLRLSNKEPFDWLYFTPAITVISNLQDQSYSATPELLYTGIKDIELRFKATFLHGAKYSEFGEKRNSQRYEFRLRYFF